MKKITSILLLGICSVFAFAQVPVPKPAAAQSESITISQARLHLGDGKVIESGYISFDKGKITAIGTGAVPASLKGKLIDGKNKDVYPGFILPASTLGLREIDALRPTLDFAERGEYNSTIRSLVAYNAESELIPTLKFNGILLAQIAPLGGTISGQSSIMQLDAWNWQDAAYLSDEGLWINWPDLYSRSGWWAEPGDVNKNEQRNEYLKGLRNFIAESKSYCSKPGREANLPYQAMCKALQGKQKVYIRVAGAKEIIEAVQTMKAEGLNSLVLVGAKESWRVADFLAKENIPVILSALHDLPTHDDDAIDQVYSIPGILKSKGVKFCLSIEPVRELMGSRNLPFIAGNAVSYGLSKEDALSSITLHAAEILGIDSRTGSLSIGKDANLILSNGDALDMRSNQIEKAFIQGRELDLRGKQQALYERYLEKMEGAKK
jgi:imidazolonepropionase-like amidohydrolase